MKIFFLITVISNNFTVCSKELCCRQRDITCSCGLVARVNVGRRRLVWVLRACVICSLRVKLNVKFCICYQVLSFELAVLPSLHHKKVLIPILNTFYSNSLFLFLCYIWSSVLSTL